MGYSDAGRMLALGIDRRVQAVRAGGRRRGFADGAAVELAGGDYEPRRLGPASECARALRFGVLGLTLGGVLRFLVRLPALIRFLWGIPRLEVVLSDGLSGVAIADHLSLTRWGVPRFRLAQGVLQIPSDFPGYLRGRHRQALRTNVRRARERGISCHSKTVPAWVRPDSKRMCAAPVEYWWATGRDGCTVGEAWITVDESCALLHALVSSEPYARWLLHTAIVERLSASRCGLLLTNSYDTPLMTAGQQYFQRLLGYSVARLRRQTPRATPARMLRAPMGLLATAAVLSIVGEQMLNSPIHLAGHRAVIWLTALTTVRVAANRAGWATLVGAAAGALSAALGAAPAVAVAYFLCGAALDTEMTLMPCLARSKLAISWAGVTVMFVTLLAPEFPTLGHHPAGAPWTIPPILGAILFGALAATLGQRLGHALKHNHITRTHGQWNPICAGPVSTEAVI
jgi:hypothetical protein